MKKTSNLVFGGISVALIILLLYIGSFIITNKVSLMALAIVTGSISYIRGGIRPGVIVYVASSLLAFFLIPNKLYTGIYILFGIYPLIKLISEKYSTALEYTIKYICFNILVITTYFIYSSFIYLGPVFEKSYLIIAFLIVIQVLFFIFDFAFTKFIMFVQDRILNKL